MWCPARWATEDCRAARLAPCRRPSKAERVRGAAKQNELRRRGLPPAEAHQLVLFARHQLRIQRYPCELARMYHGHDSSSRSVRCACRRCCRWPTPRRSWIGSHRQWSSPARAPDSRRQECTNPRTQQQRTFSTLSASVSRRIDNQEFNIRAPRVEGELFAFRVGEPLGDSRSCRDA